MAILSAIDAKNLADNLSTTDLLQIIMVAVQNAAENGFYSLALPYLLNNKQTNALLNIGYVVTTSEDGTFSSIDWSSPLN